VKSSGRSCFPLRISFAERENLDYEMEGSRSIASLGRHQRANGSSITAVARIQADRCAGLEWFDARDLPHPTMPYTEEIVRLYLTGSAFSLHGWPVPADPGPGRCSPHTRGVGADNPIHRP
jgi:hypothetical protein